MSNQETLYRNIFASIMITTLIAGYSFAHSETPTVHAQDNEVVVSTPSAQPKSTTVSHSDTPEDYIQEVFGEHADKAFLLLKGKGPGTCAENRNLDQNAHNHNWTKVEGVYWSTDWGIFQINDKFHPVEKLNLRTDWKANIDYAWRMFKNDNYSFQRWTCGKIYGI